MVEVVAIPAAHIGSLKGSFALPRADMWGAACQLKLPIRPVEMQGFRSFWSGPAVLRRSMWQAFTGPGRFYKIYYLQHLILQRPRRHTHLHFPALSPSPSPPPTGSPTRVTYPLPAEICLPSPARPAELRCIVTYTPTGHTRKSCKKNLKPHPFVMSFSSPGPDR